MAGKQLTERQKQIKRLIDQGQSPGEVAKTLKVTENAIYQQLARIRKKRTTGTTAKRPARRTTPAPSAAVSVNVATPLQAIRARRAEVEHTVKKHADELEAASKALNKAQETYDGAKTKIADELARLEAAENALTGAKPAQKRQRRGSNSRGTQAPAPAASAPPAPTPTPESAPAAAVEADPQEDAGPVEPPRDREVELARAGADEHDSPGEEERPGVPVDPDFEREIPEGDEAAALVGAGEEEFQGEDPFGS